MINEETIEGEPTSPNPSRRTFLKQSTALAALALAPPIAWSNTVHGLPEKMAVPLEPIPLQVAINGTVRQATIESRVTLLDLMREQLDLTGTKKGCDHGQCGACTVLVGGRRVLSCLTLAATCEGKSITTIEGLAKGDELHPLQASFLKHDGYQCGYCTPGQLCSAVALLDEARRGDASYVTADVRTPAGPLQLSNEEIQERMSGNICRCGAYTNIVDAIREVHTGQEVAQVWQFANE